MSVNESCRPETRALSEVGPCSDTNGPRRAAEALDLLAEASALLSSSLDDESTLPALAGLVAPRWADWCSLYLEDEDGTLRQVAVAHAEPEKARLVRMWRQRHPVGPGSPQGILQLLRPDSPLLYPEIPDGLLESLTQDAEHLRFLRSLGLRSAVVAPLRARGRAFGALALVNAESGRRITAVDVRLAEQLAHCAALAVDSARLYRETQEARRRREEEQRITETLHRIGISLTSELDPVRLVQSITDAAVALTGAAFGALFETHVDERGESFYLYTLSGAPREAFARYPMPRATAIFGPTFRGERTLRVDDITQHPDYGKSAPHRGMPEGHLPVRSYLAVSVRSGSGKVLGGLFFGHPEPGRFTEVHARLAEGVAAQAAVALDNARLYDEARRAEHRFRSLVTATAQAVWVTRPDGDLAEDTPSWRAFTGQTYEACQGPGWLAALHPEDRERAAGGWREAVARRSPYEMEYRVRRTDGSYAITLARAVPIFNADGSVREWVGANTDVTAQRVAEEASRRLEREQRARRLEALRAEVSEALSHEEAPTRMLQACAHAMVRHLDVPLAQVWTWNRDTQQLLLEGNAGAAAPAAGQPTRLELGQLLVGTVGQQRHPLLINDIQQHPLLCPREWARRQGLVSFVGIPLLVRGQMLGVLALFGQRRLVEDTLATLATVADAIAQGLERRRAELALQLHVQELARSNEELQQFAYVASHDLQEPLRMVASYTQLLARRYRGRLDADADEFIGFAVDGVNRMQRLIQDLIAYSRVSSRGHEFKPVESGRALERALANLKAAVDETGATLTLGTLPAVMADEMQLAQLFQNLIGNALKFHGQAPPQVVIGAERQGTEWRFTVRDNGIGIDPKYFERIFVIFQRLHGKREYPGTGIGLAICKKIVERHGGRIGLTSQQGHGTTFWFTLPAIPSLQGPTP